VTEIFRVGGPRPARRWRSGPSIRPGQDRDGQRLCHRRQTPALRIVVSTPWPDRRDRGGADAPTIHLIAADLLRRPTRSRRASILIADDQAFAASWSAEVERQCARRPAPTRRLVARPRRGDHRGAGGRAGPVDRIAPSTSIAIDDPERLADRVRHAGAISSAATPPSAGDYVPGPTTCCRPSRRASRLGFPSTTSQAQPRSSAAAPRRSRRWPERRDPGNAEGLPRYARSVSIRRNMRETNLP